MIKLIIFDYDGVIVDSFSNCHKIYQIMCRELGKKCPEDIDEFKKVYGHTSSECYAQLGFSEAERLEANKIFEREVLKMEPKVFDGIIEVLRALHGKFKIVLLSASYQEELDQKTRKFGIHDLFDFIVGRASSSTERFKKTDTMIRLMNDLNIKADEVLSIGDRNVDFTDGTDAGIKNILLVEYGWGYNLSELPDYNQKVIVKNPSDILAAINHFE
jgi:phosphoglycolate phosphatase